MQSEHAVAFCRDTCRWHAVWQEGPGPQLQQRQGDMRSTSPTGGAGGCGQAGLVLAKLTASQLTVSLTMILQAVSQSRTQQIILHYRHL